MDTFLIALCCNIFLNIEKQDYEEITIVLNTFRRPELMADAVNHYSSCGCVSFIYIVWSESVPPPEDLKASYVNMKSPKVRINLANGS